MSNQSKETSSMTDKEKWLIEKKKYPKKLLRIAFLLFLLMSVAGTALFTWLNTTSTVTQYPAATEHFYVNDYSGVFSEETEGFIQQQAVALSEATKAQIVLAAVPETQADSLEDYSNQLANDWGIGDAALDNGVLILFTTNEPQVRLEVGMGLEGCLNDAKSGRILDEWAVEAKDNARWNEAAINTWVAAAQEVYAEYGLTAPEALATVDSALEEPQTNTMADADFPEAVVVKNTESLPIQLMTAFFVTWMIFLIPFFFVLYLIYTASPMYYKESDFTGEGKLKKQKVVSDHDRDHDFGGSGGGYSGGGGSFGGGGASR